MNLTKNHFISLIFFLIPVTLITGPFLPDLFLSIISVYYLSKLIKNKEYNNLNNKFSIFFLFFYFYILLRSLSSIDPLNSLEHSLFYIRYLFFVLATIYLINNFKNFLKYFTLVLSLTFLIIMSDALFQFIYDSNFIGFENKGNHLINSFFGDREVLGIYLARLAPLLIGLLTLVLANNLRNNLFIIFILSFSILITFLSGDRSEVVISIISSVMILFSFKRYKNIKWIMIILIPLFMIFQLSSSENLKQKFVYNINEKINQGYFISWKHEAMIKSSYKMFNDNPLFGQGSKMFRLLCDEEEFLYHNPERNDKLSHGCSTHPHNIYFEILAENGLVGFSFIFFIFIFFSIKIFKHIILIFLNKPSSYNSSKICFMICIYINLIPMIPSMSLFNNWASVIYFLPVGFYLSNTRNINFKKDIKESIQSNV